MSIRFFKIDTTTTILIPFFPEGIKAGFPSPATDYLEEAIDLNKELIKNPSSTFLGKATGDSMIDEGIDEGDVLVIDKSLPFENNKKILVYLEGGFTVKKLSIQKGKMYLVPGNPDYKPILINADVTLWGVVTYIIKKC